MARLTTVVLIACALSAGFLHFCRDAGRVERSQREAARRSAEWLRQWMIDQGFIAAAYPEAGTLVVVPGPRFTEMESQTRRVNLGYLAAEFCNDREAPILLLSRSSQHSH